MVSAYGELKLPAVTNIVPFAPPLTRIAATCVAPAGTLNTSPLLDTYMLVVVFAVTDELPKAIWHKQVIRTPRVASSAGRATRADVAVYASETVVAGEKVAIDGIVNAAIARPSNANVVFLASRDMFDSSFLVVFGQLMRQSLVS